jgi:hypothetical protein
MTRVSELHKRWLEDATYREMYDALEEEFAMAGAVIEVRKSAGIPQQLAQEDMGGSKTRFRPRSKD